MHADLCWKEASNQAKLALRLLQRLDVLLLLIGIPKFFHLKSITEV